MSLRNRIIIILLAVGSLLTVLGYATQRFIVLPGYLELEQKEAQKDAQRVTEAINREIKALTTLTHDWAAWDDTYNFAQNQNRAYVESNITIETFSSNNKLNLLLILDIENNVIWGGFYDPKIDADDYQLISNSWKSLQKIWKYNPSWENDPKKGIFSGAFITEKGPMILSFNPIITSKEKGPIRGVLIMGRFFDSNLIKKLIKQTNLSFDAWVIGQKDFPVDKEQILQKIRDINSSLITEADKNILHIYTPLPDPQSPTLLLRIDISRKIISKGQEEVNNVMILGFLLILSILIILWWLLEYIIIKPLQDFTAYADTIRKSGNLSRRLPAYRIDEIGQLNLMFNGMMIEIQKVHDCLEQKVKERTRYLELAMQSLEENEAKIRALFEATSDSVLLLNPRGNIIKVNRNLLQRIGIPKAENIIGKSIFDFLPGDLSADGRNKILQIIQEGIPKKIEERYADLIFDIRVFPIFSNGCKDANMIAVFARDITLQKLIELEIIHRLALASEYRDTDTGNHIWRVGTYCECLAKSCGQFTDEEIRLIRLAAMMHDVGKIGIEDYILFKPGKLTEEEFEIMKGHTLKGAKILSTDIKSESLRKIPIPILKMATKIALHHHERWDGKGYPHGIVGKNIPRVGRVTAIVDIFDALTMERPYKKPWPVEKALAEIRAMAGSHLDPEIVDVFFRIQDQILLIKEKYKD